MYIYLTNNYILFHIAWVLLFYVLLDSNDELKYHQTLNVGEDEYHVNLQRKNVWQMTFVYHSALKFGMNYTLLSFLWRLSVPTIRKYIYHATAISTTFLHTYYLSNQYWTVQRLKSEIPEDVKVIYGRYFVYNVLFFVYNIYMFV